MFFGITEKLNIAFIIVPIFGTLIFAAIFIILASTIFKTRFFQNTSNLIFMITEMAQYPNTIYPLPIKIILIVIPLAFISYYPLVCILKKEFYNFAFLLIGAIVLFLASTILFEHLAKNRNEIYD